MTHRKNYKRNLFTLLKSCPFVAYTLTNKDKKPKMIQCTTELPTFSVLIWPMMGSKEALGELRMF